MLADVVVDVAVAVVAVAVVAVAVVAVAVTDVNVVDVVGMHAPHVTGQSKAISSSLHRLTNALHFSGSGTPLQAGVVVVAVADVVVDVNVCVVDVPVVVVAVVAVVLDAVVVDVVMQLSHKTGQTARSEGVVEHNAFSCVLQPAGSNCSLHLPGHDWHSTGHLERTKSPWKSRRLQ